VRPEGFGKFKKKMHSLHWGSNPRPSGLQHSVLTTMLQRASNPVDAGGYFLRRNVVGARS
jgi:hypothetical protein